MIVDYSTGEYLARTHRCVRCGEKSTLVVPWNAQANSYEVRCGVCRGDTFEPRPSLTRQWRRDPDSVPVAVANTLERKYGGRPMTTRALTTIDQKTMLQRMEGARWTKELAPQDRAALAELAVTYHLDPVMGELILYEGKPYITTAGHLRRAAGHPRYEGLSHRPLTGPERQEYAIGAPVACRVEVWKRGMRVPAVGIGTADPANPLRGNPMEKREPYRQALSRATRQALRMYFPHGLPMEYAEEAGIYVDAHSGDVLADAMPQGEVVEGEVRELAPEPSDEETEPATPEEQARARITMVLTSAGRRVDDKLLAYFRTVEGVEWEEAPLEKLSHFSHHCADILAAKEEKRDTANEKAKKEEAPK